jgi:hypothetical protein
LPKILDGIFLLNFEIEIPFFRDLFERVDFWRVSRSFPIKSGKFMGIFPSFYV